MNVMVVSASSREDSRCYRVALHLISVVLEHGVQVDFAHPESARDAAAESCERDRVGSDVALHVDHVEPVQVTEVGRVATDHPTQSLGVGRQFGQAVRLRVDVDGNA